MGGAGGGFAHSDEELRNICSGGLAMSPIGQCLIEMSIAGWKEIEFEVIRDKLGNKIIVCSMENVDPVGIHTGDSIVVAPCLTLADKELQMLRTASLNIVEALGVEGGCNVQLALNPNSFEYAVIEVNPRVSRSSALASKATGYLIAKVATQIAIGYTLDEIENPVTKTTKACFEPALDYVVVKLPKFPFDKFVYAENKLGTQMKATGEVMAISDNFENALIKAVRGAELGLKGLDSPRLLEKKDSEIRKMLHEKNDQRLFVVYEALKRGVSIDEVHEITKIDRWFLYALIRIKNNNHQSPNTNHNSLIYKMVDTCAGEFDSKTAYFYSLENGEENEALPFIQNSKKEKVVVLGSGPIRIGQGIEFDYASVHCVWTLRKLGYDAIVINNNPETLSTDFDTADRLYFEPLCIDDVMNIINIEKPIGVVVAFGGGTAIKLAKDLSDRGVKILGTSADAIDICEDRDRFDKLLEGLNIRRPDGVGVFTKNDALKEARKLGYPVLMRPSYVLGGQNMIIAFNDDDIIEYMDIILRRELNGPVLIDKYLKGREIEVDAICDGEEVLIPGIMEQIEATGVHSGDSIAVYPTINVGKILADRVLALTKKIVKSLDVRGLVNIQYVLFEGEIYVIEVNPRASRTVPYISKVTGIDMCELAVRCSLGEKLKDLTPLKGIAPVPDFVTVKVPVFSFEKLAGLDTLLGPEMKSTGEVLGLGRTLEEALYKGLLGAGYKMKKKGGVLITVSDSDKDAIIAVARKFKQEGFELYSTKGTAKFLSQSGIDGVQVVEKVKDSKTNNTIKLLESGKVSYVVSTSEKGRDPAKDDVKVRRRAVQLGISYVTSVDTARALIYSIASGYSEETIELIDINSLF